MEDISNVNSSGNPVSDPVSQVPVQKAGDGSQYEVKAVAPEDLDSSWLRWKCLVCGYVYEGAKPLKKCPKCGNENPDKFADAE